MNKIYKLLYSHEIGRMPDEIKHRKNIILTLSIISTLFLDILSFSIKGAQAALAADMKILALALMVLYFIRQVVRSSIQIFIDNHKNILYSQEDVYISEKVSHISNVVRGKVFQKSNNSSLIMTNSEVIFNLKEYISYVWNFFQSYPIAISEILTALGLSIAILITEFVQTGNVMLTISFSVVLIVCIILFLFLQKFRLNVRKQYRENHRKLRKQSEVRFNDIKNIEPLIKNEFTYRVILLVSNSKEKRFLEKKENFKLNSLYILKTLILAVFMILIIIIKLHYAGGVHSLSTWVLTDIIAVSSVYSNILDIVASILHRFENLSNILKDIEHVKVDVDNIMQVYEDENNIEFAEVDVISKITVEPFEFSYPNAKSVYKLRNITPFELFPGKAYLVHGHTGCGKSTFMHLLNGKIKMNHSPISYGNTCDSAYLASIMHESNGKLGANPVLQELIFSEDLSILNRSRMIEILHGTYIYEDIKRNLGLSLDDDDKVLEYLNNTTIEQYSSGQKQRLSIVKVLYNLNSTHQIVVFDEATNALDNSTAISVLNFIINYCQQDMNRIVLLVSHQVNLTKDITDGTITFTSKTFPIFDIVFEA